MTYAYRSTTIGQGSTPSGELALVNSICGKALAKGDAVDVTNGTTETTSLGQFCGWRMAFFGRYEPVLYLTMPARIKRGSRVVGASLVTAVVASTFTSGVVPTTNLEVEVWAIRRTLGSTLTGLTWVNYFTSLAWAELGILFGVGADADPVKLGSFTWSQTEHDAAPSDAAPTWKTIAMRTEFERLLAFDEPIQLVYRAKWAAPASDNALIRVNQPSGTAAAPHTYFRLDYRFPLEVYGSAGGNINLADLKDANSVALQQHLYLGTPPKGAAGTVIKYFARNEITSAQAAVVVQSGQTQVSSVDNSGVAGTGRLRYVRGYNTASGQQTPSGRWRLVFTAATTYDVKFTADGSLTESTITTGKSTASNEVIQVSALNALQLNIEAWAGTFAAADVVAFETRGDLHTVAIPLSSLDSVRLTPHSAGDRSAQDTSRANVATYTTTQQLYRHDAAVIANSSGVTGVIATVTDSGTWTHVKVPDAEALTADHYAVLANFNAADESVGTPGTNPGTRLERVRIKTVYSLSHGTYPGQVRLYETLTNPTDFDGNSILTTGLWLGKLTAPDQGFLASAASVSSDTITLDEALVVSSFPVTATLLDPVTGTTETRSIIAYLGSNQYRLSAAPSFAYPAASFVFFATETTSNCPFYVYAQPAASVARGRKLGYVAAAAFAIT